MALALWKDMKEPILLDGEPEIPAFGDGGLLDARTVAGKLDSEQRFVPNRPPMTEITHENVQTAQGWNGIPSLPPPRLSPESRGYDIQGKEALEGLGDVPQTLDQNAAFNAIGRQTNIQSQHDADRRRISASQSSGSFFAIQPRQPYLTDTIAPVGRGVTHKSSEGKYYTDRNGDGASDIILRYRDGKTFVDYGDGNGLSVYDPKRYRPAPPHPGRR